MRLDEIDRRGFLKGLGAAAAGVNTNSFSKDTKEDLVPFYSNGKWAVYIDKKSIEKADRHTYEMWLKIIPDNPEYSYKIFLTVNVKQGKFTYDNNQDGVNFRNSGSTAIVSKLIDKLIGMGFD